MKDERSKMNADANDLIRLNRSLVKPAAEVLGQAFRDYPLVAYAFPDKSEREKMAPLFCQCILYYAVRYGEVYATSSRMEGVAAWATGDTPMNFWRTIRSVPLSVVAGIGRAGGSRLRHPGYFEEAMHRRLTPFKHWILLMIGVPPQVHGKGYASKLMSPMLARIDEQGLPCYLSTHEEKNTRLYEHFGFRVIEKSDIPRTGLTIWAMLRDSRQAWEQGG